MIKRLPSALRLCVFILLLLVGSGVLVYASTETTQTTQTAALLSIKGGIGPGTHDFISRGLKKAQQSGAHVVVLQIDTPGGLSKSMRGIIKDMLASPIPVIAYVAPSGARAASAGTYILYAAQIAAMAPGTNLGAATPVAIGAPGMAPKNNKAKTKKQSSASAKKAINDARAYIRSLAQLRGRNVKWAEKAVVEGESLSANEALKLNVINLIAKDVPELLQKINGKSVIVRGLPYKLNTENLTIKQIEPDWRSRFLAVITDPSVAYILLMLGVYGIFFEFLNPGFVAPGVIGAIALLIGLYALALLPINYAGLALIVLGLGFIIAEVFMPSFGILGIGGAISFVFGSIFLMKTTDVGFQLPIYLVILVTIVTLIFIIFILGVAVRSRRKPVVSGGGVLIGKKGTIEVADDNRLWLTLVGERWQCKSDSQLKNGQRVVVKKLEGLTLVVEPVSSHSTEE